MDVMINKGKRKGRMERGRRMRAGMIYNKKTHKELGKFHFKLIFSLDQCELVGHIYEVIGQGHTLTK